MAKIAPSTLDPVALGEQLGSIATEWKTYQCTLVTPMYGGGVKAGEVDKEMPIRATEIRGQLRFWWRLLNCKKYSDTQALFNAERDIWGGLGDEKTLAASKVVLKIANVNSLQIEHCAEYKLNEKAKLNISWKSWAHPYVLFPAQGKVERGQVTSHPGKLAREGLSWELHVSYGLLPDEAARSVYEALRWWATFGGMGARNRRGLGAVEIKVLNEERSLNYVTAEEVAQAGMQLALQKPAMNAIEAWKQSINAMQKFRQGEEVGRNKGRKSNRPGRSRWPEPASIRKSVGVHRIKEGGEISFAPAETVEVSYPRAAFGLPIIFHFQNEKTDINTDPADTQLVPYFAGEVQERMASSLILKPCLNEKGEWCPAVLHISDGHLSVMDVKLISPTNEIPKTDGDWGLGKEAISSFIKYFKTGVVTNPPYKVIVSKHEERWEKAQVKFDKVNGALTVEKDGKSATAIKPASDVILKYLLPISQQKIQTGQFFRATATIKGRELLKLEESK